MRRVEPISSASFDPDTYERESILRAENRRDGTPMTNERAIEFAKQVDPDFKVTLCSTDIPAFLYDNKGIIK